MNAKAFEINGSTRERCFFFEKRFYQGKSIFDV